MSTIDASIATIRRLASMAAIEETARGIAVKLLCCLQVIPTDGDFAAVAHAVRTIVAQDRRDIPLQTLRSATAARLDESEQEAENVLGAAMLSIVEGCLVWHVMSAQMDGLRQRPQRKGPVRPEENKVSNEE